MYNFRRIFKPTEEERIEDLEMVLKSHNNHIGDCSTCANHITSSYPGFVTDYGECKKNMELFPEKVCGTLKVDCKYYTENISTVTDINNEIERIKTMIFTGERNCENCSHREVCSLKNSFMEFTQSANQLIDIYKQRFDFVISCKHFREDAAIKAPFVK